MSQSAENDAPTPHCPRCGRNVDPNKRHQHWKPWPHEGFTSYLCVIPPEATEGDSE